MTTSCPSSRAFRTVGALALSFGLLAASCGKESSSKDVSGSSTTIPAEEAKPTDLKDLKVRPVVETPSADAPAKLKTTDIVVGTGAEAAKDTFVVVDYVGQSYSNGKIFDESWTRGEPFTLQLGAGMVIPGWDQGLVGMKVGGRRELIIPPDLAYGEQGQGDIGPNETLIFVVDLRAVMTEPKMDVTGIAKPTALVSKDITVGTGDALKSGDSATFQYVGALLADGKTFDSSWSKGQPFSTAVGVGSVIKGWDEGLIGMKEGGRRQLVIPADLAYGAAGAGGGTIPANADLVFIVDLISITPAQTSTTVAGG